MNLCLAGLNYRSAGLKLRERLSIPARELPATLSLLTRTGELSEIVILSTCNRTEFYVVAGPEVDLRDHFLQSLSHLSGLESAVLGEHLYLKTGAEVAAHLFRVSAGLDSMILGESEIASQVKQAYQAAREHGATGPILNRLFQKASHAAKLIRTQTGIAHGHASIGSIVVDIARAFFQERLAEREVLLWGSGKAAEVTAQHLARAGVGRLSIVNRTASKAQELAETCRGNWVSWEQAQQRLGRADIAIVCTQAPHFVIDRQDAERMLPERAGRPLLLIDLAVPRNVDPEIRSLSGVRVLDVDDLQEIAQRARREREGSLEACEQLVSDQVNHFVQWQSETEKQEDLSCRLGVLCPSG